MDFRSRDRTTTSQGFRVGSGSADLIGDIHRQQRRRILRRAAQVAALAFTLLLIGLAFKFAADRRARVRSLESARGHFLRGTLVEMREAVGELDESLADDPDHEPTLAALALAQAQLAVEFGEGAGPGGTLGRFEDPDDHRDHRDAVLATAMLAFSRGQYDKARTGIAAARSMDADTGIAPHHDAWLEGMVVLADVQEGPEVVQGAMAHIDRALHAEPGAVAYRRVKAGLHLMAGDGEQALAELDRAREQSRTHMGLAGDEALYNAYLRQELSAVADVADQLLAAEPEVLGARDQAHALLARAVVHVQAGERKQGIERTEAAWDKLGVWDRLPRELALQTILQAGDATRVAEWTEDTGLPDDRAALYRAWGQFARGDVMVALNNLAKLPQELSRVAYLQALALVEQRRFEEAGPWLERTEKLLPGRIEVEVARARVQLRSGDKVSALRKLEALANEEPYAPRAWTGLGEAYLLQEPPDLGKAERALERAVEREPVPAEAMLQLAEVWRQRRRDEPKAWDEALEQYQKAAKINPHLPRYRQELAIYLADYGQPARARKILAELAEEPGVEPHALLRLVELGLDEKAGPPANEKQLEAWLAKAEEAGASHAGLAGARARMAIAAGSAAELEDARRSLADVLEDEPADVEARVLLARVFLKSDQRDEAETTLRRGLQVEPDDRHGRLYWEWSRIEARTGKRARAAAHASVAWRMMAAEDRPASELLDVAEDATSLWIRQRNAGAALAIGRDLSSRFPNNGRAWSVRAEAELAANRSTDARSSVERAIELKDDAPRTHEIHGHTLLRFGLKGPAREAYERAISRAQGTTEEAEYRENLRRF